MHNRSASSSSFSKRIVPPSIRRALDIRRFESSQHRRKRLEASRLNTLAPISCLPPELLCRIFLFCAASPDGAGPCWLAVTHVTHHWREVALACPELWANIIFRPKLVPIMLARSKDAPLVIRVDLDSNKHLKSMTIRENIAKVGVLDVRGSQSALDTLFVDHVGQLAAPRLGSLAVANTIAGDPFWLDARVFHGIDEPKTNLPRQLRLERAALPWNSPWYNNLTDLYLADLHKAHGPTMTMLLSVIVASPLLQHLTLINTQTRIDDLNMYRLFPVVLADLRTLHLSEPISVCAQLLMDLTFPSIVTVIVSCTLSPASEASLVSTILCHRDFCQTSNFLLIDAPTSEHLCIRTTSSSDKTLRIDLHHGRRRLSLGWALQNLVISRSTFFSCITVLYIGTALGFDSWRHLCHCRELAVLFLYAADPLPIFAILLEHAMRCIGMSIRPQAETDLDPDGACRQIFPELESIRLIDIDCGDSRLYLSITDILRSLLWARRTGRRPIADVRLKACKNVFQQDVEYFTFLTDSFTWDGVGKNEKEKEDSGLDMRNFSLSVLEHLMWDSSSGLFSIDSWIVKFP
ncbi:F-box domain-containing protein [Mycena sanguinolenta]|uniref:F-box domain-containing protein n=1 Tax=Mycena sanguinolenta TaxID=230812 RepID=A0A8H6Z0T5_9AGAR|nr:F-box domain-containing protein [Mycena sanguinolenta]